MVFNPKQLFLIDGIGALLSAFFLGVVLVRFEAFIGLPGQILRILALLPCLFAIYSFSCYFFRKGNWSILLSIIAIANLLYCVLTLGILIMYAESLTKLGWLYFLVEIVIIVILVTFELRVGPKDLNTNSKGYR